VRINLARVTKDKEILQEKLAQEKRNIESIKTEESNKSKENEILVNLKNSSNLKLKELREKMDKEKKGWGEKHAEYEYKIESLQREMHEKIIEGEDLSWQLEKVRNSIDELNLHYKAQKEEIMRMSPELFEREEKCKKLEEQMRVLSC
jgi:predicted  nucleic acid-binding Zn-ribbon protein